MQRLLSDGSLSTIHSRRDLSRPAPRQRSAGWARVQRTDPQPSASSQHEAHTLRRGYSTGWRGFAATPGIDDSPSTAGLGVSTGRLTHSAQMWLVQLISLIFQASELSPVVGVSAPSPALDGECPQTSNGTSASQRLPRWRTHFYRCWRVGKALEAKAGRRSALVATARYCPRYCEQEAASVSDPGRLGLNSVLHRRAATQYHPAALRCWALIVHHFTLNVFIKTWRCYFNAEVAALH